MAFRDINLKPKRVSTSTVGRNTPTQRTNPVTGEKFWTNPRFRQVVEAGRQEQNPNEPNDLGFVQQTNVPFIVGRPDSLPTNYTPSVSQTTEPEFVTVKSHYGQDVPVPIKDKGWLGSANKGGYFADIFTSLGRELSAFGARTGMAEIGKGLTSWVGGLSAKFSAAHYLTSNPNQMQAHPEKTRSFADLDPITKAGMLEQEVTRRSAGSQKAEEGLGGMWKSFWDQVGRKDQLIPVERGTVDKIGDLNFKAMYEQGRVDWMTPYEYYEKKADEDFALAAGYFADFKRDPRSNTIELAEQYGWKQPETDKSFGASLLRGLVTAFGPSSVQQEPQVSAVEFLQDKAATLTDEAFVDLRIGDVARAHAKRVEAITIERAAGGKSGMYDPYFGYTWITAPEREKEFIDTVAAMEMQLGRPLSNFEVWKARDSFVDPWKEFAGDMIFDWTNVAGAVLEEPVRQLTTKVAAKLVRGIEQSTNPLLAPARWTVANFGKKAVRSAANNLAHKASEIFMDIAHAMGSAPSAGDDFVKKLGEVGVALAEGVPENEFSQALGLPASFAGRQERVLMGLSNVFKASEDLAESSIEPSRWADLAKEAKKQLFDEAYKNESERLIAKGLTQDLVEQRAAAVATKLASDPKRVVTYMAQSFRDQYLKAMAVPETGLQHTFNRLTSMWANAVLSYRPAWMFRNYVDNAFRYLVFGGNPLEGLDLLVGRLGDLPENERLLRQMGMLPTELGESFARNVTGGGETILQKSASGWTPRGFWDFFRESNKEAQASTAFSAKWADMLLGTTTDEGVTTTAMRKAWNVLKAGAQVAGGTLGGGISDWNNAIETAFKLRMFEKQLTANLRTLSKTGKEITLRTLATNGASERVQGLVSRLWDLYYTNPTALRDALTELRLGDSPLMRVVNSLTPANLDEMLSVIDEDKRLLFIANITENMRKAIELDKLNGREFKAGAFFDDLLKDFEDYKADLLNKVDTRDAPNASPRVTDDVDPDITPSNNAVPGKKAPSVFTETKKPRIEAVDAMRTARTPKNILSNLRDATDRFEFVQGGTNAVNKPAGGKVVVTFSPDILKARNKEARATIQDMLAQAFELEGQGSKADILEFWTDPKKLMARDRAAFDKLANLFDNDPDLRKMIAGLYNKKSLDYLNAIPTTDLVEKDMAKVVEAGAKKIDIVQHYYPDTVAAGRLAGKTNVDFHDVITDTSVPINVRSHLIIAGEQLDLVMDKLQAFTAEIYPGYRRIEHWTIMREKAWDQRQDMLERFWTGIAKAKRDLIARGEEAAKAGEKGMPPLRTILESLGYHFEFKKDGTLRRMLYEPLDPGLGEHGSKMVFATRPAPTEEFLRRFFGSRVTNDTNTEKLLSEVPYTRKVAQGVIPDNVEPRIPTPTAEVNHAVDWVDTPPVPLDTNTPARALPAKVKAAIEAKIGKSLTPDGTKKIVQKYDNFTRDDFIGLLEEELKAQEAKDILALEDTIGQHWVELNGGTLDDYYRKAVLDNGLADDGVGLYDSRWYYSQLQKTVETMPDKMSADQFRGWIKGKVKGAELSATHIEDFLKEHPKFTKAELLSHLEENNVQLEEKILSDQPIKTPVDMSMVSWQRSPGHEANTLRYGNEWIGSIFVSDGQYQAERFAAMGNEIQKFPTVAEAEQFVMAGLEGAELTLSPLDPTKYGSVNLPGGTNYREILFHYEPPSGENFNAPHFGDYSQNLLGHVRMDDRVDDQGRKVLNIVEVQSDWNQRGRKYGYTGEIDQAKVLRLNDQITQLDTKYRELTFGTPEWDRLNIAADNADNALYEHNQNLTNEIRKDRRAYDAWKEDKARLEQDLAHKRSQLFIYEDSVPEIKATREERTRLLDELSRISYPDSLGSVPHNPFEKNWPQVFMKRIMNYASENGCDVVTFPTGPVAAKIEGHQIVENIDRLTYDDVQHILRYHQKDGTWGSKEVMPDQLAENIGDDLAKDLLASPVPNRTRLSERQNELLNQMIAFEDAHPGFEPQGIEMGLNDWPEWSKPYQDMLDEFHANQALIENEGLVSHVLDTKDAVFGGEKMRPFYDEILPNTVNDLLKKHGLQVEDITLDGGLLSLDEAEAALRRGENVHYKLPGAEEWQTWPLNENTLEAIRRMPEYQGAKLFIGDRPSEGAVTVHGFTLNDSLKTAAKAGQPLFDLRGAKKLGSTQWLEDGRALTKIFTGEADKYTFVHETAHRLLPMMPDEDIAVVKDWLKTEHNIDVPDGWQFGHTANVKEKELFADAFLTYISEGKAPNAKLKTVFEHFKDWLMTIYKSLTGRDEPKLNDEMRTLFDKWLGETPAQPKKLPAARPRRNLLVNDVQDLLPDEQQVVTEALAKQKQQYATRSKLYQPVGKIKDPRAVAMIQNEAQEMMLDIFNLDGFEGRPMNVADFKDELVRRFPWAKELENDLPATRKDLIEALEAVVSGDKADDPFVKKLRHLAIHNLENGVTDDGTTTRLAHPYLLQQLQAETEEIDALVGQWTDGMKRNPLDELNKAAEAQENKTAFWRAFTQQKWLGDKSIAQAWGQFARSPEIFAAYLRDLMENLPEGVSDETIEGLQLLAFQVQNFYAISNNFADKLGLLRSARNEAFSVIPQSRSLRSLPKNFQNWFNEVGEGASQVSAFENAMKTWREHAVNASATPLMQMDRAELDSLSTIADRAARNKQTILNVATYGAEDDLYQQIKDTLGFVVNKKLQDKKVDGKWVPLDAKELATIERLKANLADQTDLLAGVQNIPEGALPKTNRYMINYGDYTRFDEMMKKVFPFWTFSSRSIPFWMETMMTHPQIISAYQKFMALDRRIQKQNGLYTTTGEPMPSLEGYLPIPGTDLWFDPAASLSFRYLLPDYQYLEDEYGDLPISNQVLGWLYERSNLTGIGLSPLITAPIHMLGWDRNNGQPMNSIVPQVGLLPPWWNASIRNAVGKATGEGDVGQRFAELLVGSEQPWKDYMVERRILANALDQIKNAGSPEEKNAILAEVQAAFKTREGAKLWDETLRQIETSEMDRGWAGYLSGTYFKEFTDEELDFQRLRDEVSALRNQINDAAGAELFKVDGSAEDRYNKYSNKLYKTPEGYLSILYNSMRYNRSEEGTPLYYDERRDDITKKITQEENTRAYYDKLNQLQSEYQAALMALPVGEESDKKRKLYQDYLAARTAIETDRTFEDVRRDWATGYKPESMIYEHFEMVWWKLLGETMPKYDNTQETYNAYQERLAEWKADLPNRGSALASELEKTIQAELKATPEQMDLFLLSGYNLSGGRTLDVKQLINNLQKNTNADRYDEWKKSKDNAVDALDAAWTALYWDPYWDNLEGKTDYNRAIAEQEYLNNYLKPTAEQLIGWVMANYAKGQFSEEELAQVMNDRNVRSIEERMAPKDDADAMVQRIWDILNQAGPSKSNLKEEFRKLGGDSGSLDAFYKMKEQGTGWRDPADLQEMYAKLVQAAKNLGISNTPSTAQMTEWQQAKDLNDGLDQMYKDNLGADYMTIMSEYWNASSKDRKALRKAYPQIDQYYQIRDWYTQNNPVWAKYYTEQSSSSSSSGGSGSSSGSYKSGSSYSGGSMKYKSTSTYSNTSSSTGSQYTLGMGMRSNLDAKAVPFSLGKGGATPGIRIPVEFRKVIGKVATEELENGTADETTMKYIDEVVKRHPDMVDIWGVIKGNIQPVSVPVPVAPELFGPMGSGKPNNMLR